MGDTMVHTLRRFLFGGFLPWMWDVRHETPKYRSWGGTAIGLLVILSSDMILYDSNMSFRSFYVQYGRVWYGGGGISCCIGSIRYHRGGTSRTPPRLRG